VPSRSHLAFLAVFFGVLFRAGVADAQTGAVIQEIRVRGARRTAPEDVLASIESERGGRYDPARVARDVRALWDLHFFDDVRVDLEETSGGVILTIVVRERPAIRRVILRGNDEIEDDKIKEVLDVREGGILDVPQVRRNVVKIRDLYNEKGFFLAEITQRVRRVGPGEVDVVFRIREHAEVLVRRIRFVGNRFLSAEKLREVMGTSEGGPLSFLTEAGTYRQDVFERDVTLLSALYYDYGFLDVRVSEPEVALSPDRESVFITIPIEEGRRYKIGRIQVHDFRPDHTERELLGGRRRVRGMITSARGEYFSRSKIGKDLLTITNHYKDAGYANVNVEPVTRTDPEHRIVDVSFEIERGPIVYFERIQIRGNEKTRDRVIRREMEIVEGERYSQTRLDASQQRITALGYFERVDISTRSGSADDRMIVNVEVVEKPTGTFQVGAGFSSVENFIATAQIAQQNLFGHGQSLTLQAQISGIRQLFQLQFVEPYFLGTEWTTIAELFDQTRILPDFRRDSYGGRLTYGYPIWGQDLKVFLSYLYENVDVSTIGTSAFFGGSSGAFQRLPLANLFDDGVTSSVRLSLQLDTRDNRLFPTSGGFHNLSSEFANDLFLSENQFTRYSGFMRWYLPLPLGIVFKTNTQFGLVTSPRPEGVPIHERYFLGGIFDVRGFQRFSIGPRLALTSDLDPSSPRIRGGAIIGGNLELVQNFELEYPILDKVGIRGVFFIDAGNAYNLEQALCEAAGGRPEHDVWDACSVDPFALRTSWGFGFRWFSPLGPLRFEWGLPFDPLPGEEDIVFEFSVGNAF
jgi:outer membrane protein insertion porin family